MASSRGLDKGLKIINEKGKAEVKKDPNEIFSPKIIESCFNPAEKKKLKKKGYATDEICSLVSDLYDCSNGFSNPVVALHNNTKLGTKDKKKALSESTNIYRWAISKAIKKTVIGDPDNPDRVVWTTNKKDYDKLRIDGTINAALGDEKFKGDTDLSTLFTHLPGILTTAFAGFLKWLAGKTGQDEAKLTQAFKKGLEDNLRYINIETEHKKNVYEQSLAEVNLEFVHKVLSKLGLWCCDDSLTPASLKKDLKEIKKPAKAKKARKAAT